MIPKNVKEYLKEQIELTYSIRLLNGAYVRKQGLMKAIRLLNGAYCKITNCSFRENKNEIIAKGKLVRGIHDEDGKRSYGSTDFEKRFLKAKIREEAIERL